MDNNPHLIHFIGHQVEEMRVLILMARAQGNVKDLLQENRLHRKRQGNGEVSSNVEILSVGAKLDIALQVAEALAFLHSFEIAHRDLKSENILLMNKITPETPTTSVRLIDFGISRATQDVHSTFIQGTVSWAAPEVLQAGERGASPSASNSSESGSKKKSNVTTAVDVYSFAYLLWALLTEREPHSNYGQSVELIKSQVRSNANCPLIIPSFDQLPDASDSSACAKFSARMFDTYKSLMLDCWHSDPHRRPTMPQVVEALRSIQKMIKS